MSEERKGRPLEVPSSTSGFIDHNDQRSFRNTHTYSSIHTIFPIFVPVPIRYEKQTAALDQIAKTVRKLIWRLPDFIMLVIINKSKI